MYSVHCTPDMIIDERTYWMGFVIHVLNASDWEFRWFLYLKSNKVCHLNYGFDLTHANYTQNYPAKRSNKLLAGK